MIVCGDCGYQNEDHATFCGGCPGYLPHVGEYVADVDEPPAEPLTEAGEAEADDGDDQGWLQRVQSAITRDDAGPHPHDATVETDETGAATAEGTRTDEAADRATREPGVGGQADVDAAEEARRAKEEARTAAAVAEAARHAEEQALREAHEAAEQQTAREGADAEAGGATDPHATAGEPQGGHDLEWPDQHEARNGDDERARLQQQRDDAETRAHHETKAREKAEREAAQAAERARRAAALVQDDPTQSTSPPKGGEGVDTTRTPVPSPGQPGEGGEAREGKGAGPQARQPTVVRPQPPSQPPPKTKQKPSQRIRPGDLICGQCGEPNKPERNFCSRCANALADAEVARPPWYKRLFTRSKPKKDKRARAGERPGRRGGKDKEKAGGLKAGKRKVQKVARVAFGLFKALLVLAAIVVGIGVLGPWSEPVVDWVSERWTQLWHMIVPEYEFVHPTAAHDVAPMSDHPPDHAIDGAENTHWAAKSAEGEVLEVEFADPVDIDQIGFLSGASGDAFLEQPRPQDVHVVFDDGSSVDVELADEKEFQTFPVEGAEEVTQAEIQIRSVYPSQEGDRVSITLVRFFTRLE